MQGTKRLKTGRLVLRKHIVDDAEILFQQFSSDKTLSEHSGWNPYETLEDARGMIQQSIDSYSKESFYGWAITVDDRLIGIIGAYDFDQTSNSIKVGFCVFKTHQNNGYAYEALTCVLRYLKTEENIKTVTAWCVKDNVRSMRLLEKVGMVRKNASSNLLVINGKEHEELKYEF